jgi:L-ascorbate metabolism protein UlaG (beta-lactamase superfamily)
MRLTLVRSATLLLEIHGRRILVDPMLDDVGARHPVENTPNPRRNPLVPLPIPAAKIVENLDAVIVTHLHKDHFDDTAAQLLPRGVPVFCQPEDEERLRMFGLNAHPINGVTERAGLSIARTAGRHGHGPVGEMLAPVSGFVLDDLYIAGDTVWCEEVEEAIETHRPRVAVVNGSGARFLDSEPIVMTVDDVRQVAARVPTVVVVHLEAINHCLETREDVRSAVPVALVPDDGQTLDL